MTKNELLEEIKETLQREEELNVDMELSDIEEWDSLANISIISLFDQLFEKVVTTYQLNECSTLNDVINLVSEKIEQ